MNLDFKANNKSVQYVLKRARKAALAYKGKLAVAVAHLSENNYELEEYGLTSTSMTNDILMGVRTGSISGAGYKYHPMEEGTAFSAPALTA